VIDSQSVKTTESGGVSAVISENSDSRSYHDSHGANLGSIVNFPWWRGLDDLAKRIGQA
jgi:hypothetical protein